MITTLIHIFLAVRLVSELFHVHVHGQPNITAGAHNDVACIIVHTLFTIHHT